MEILAMQVQQEQAIQEAVSQVTGIQAMGIQAAGIQAIFRVINLLIGGPGDREDIKERKKNSCWGRC